MKNKMWCAVCDLENEIVVFESKEDFCEFLENNDPQLGGLISLSDEDMAKAKVCFKDDPGCAVGLGLTDEYKSQAGIG